MTNIEALMTNFKELNRKIQDAKKEMQDKSLGLVEAVVQEFLDECPEAVGVHWTQYTPYFNDGESCEFGVNEICFHLDEDFDADESTTIYTQADLNQGIADLETAKEYQADPEAWRTKYLREYKEKFGRAYGYGKENVRPWPYKIEDAEQRIKKIEESMAKYPSDVAKRIKRSFEKVAEAIGMIDNDVMQSVYGDHVMVVINRNGTTIDEYEHH